MPDRKRDATEADGVTPETEGGDQADRREDIAANEPATGGLPPAGAESERGAVEESAPDAPPADSEIEPVETVTVDQSYTPSDPDSPEDPLVEPVPEPVVEEHQRVASLREEVASPREEEVHEEEASGSLAGKLLTFLVILILGAALGIWGAPKLAPLLPSGLQPVADWLAPGRNDSEAEIAALRTRLDEELGNLQAKVADLPAEDDITARIRSAVEESQATISSEISTLQDKVAQTSDADTGTAQRLARLESTTQGQTAELSTLKDQLAGTGQASDATAEKIDVYRAEVDGLRAEMGTLQDKVAALATRIDKVSADADRQIATAQSKVGEIQAKADTAVSAASVEAEVAQIRAAVESGTPFTDPLDKISSRQGVTVPDGLTAAAPTGVATMAELRDRFPDAAHAAIRAGVQASAGDGFLARSRAFLEAQIASRSLTPQDGLDPDAVLSRMEARLEANDLKGALTEADHLPSEVSAAMSDWLDAARLRAGAVDGLATLDASLPATN